MHISLNNVSIKAPILSSESYSLKRSLFSLSSNREYKTIIDGVDLSLLPGDRVGLRGVNGAGKTSLLRLLLGSYHPTSGSIVRVGKISSLLDIGMGLNPQSSGLSNIYLKLRLLGVSPTKDLVDSIVRFSELGKDINYPLKNYSSGMSVRLAFSIATIINPEILILDEWLSVGDSSFKEKAELRLSRLTSLTDILVIASHDNTLLEAKCNRIITLSSGKVIEDIRG